MNPLLSPQLQAPGEQHPMLQDLRDLHEPDPPPAWPPAPGWWLLTLVLLIALVWVGLKAYAYNRKRAYRQEAMRELMQAREHYRSSGDASAYAQELLELLKRTALAAYPNDRDRIAGLHGEAWLKFLDETCPQCAFNSPDGRALIHAAYSTRADPSALHHSHGQARMWIAGHRTSGGLFRA